MTERPTAERVVHIRETVNHMEKRIVEGWAPSDGEARLSHTMSAELLAEVDAITARAVAAEQRVKDLELALVRLRLAAAYANDGPHRITEPDCHSCRGCLLRDALASTDTDLAEAQRRELRAEGLSDARALVNVELQGEAVSRDRAYAAGRTEVGSHRQACVEALESAIHRIDQRAAELRGPK